MPAQPITDAPKQPGAARIAANDARRATSSVARVEANRANAQKSTGPKTAEGKAAVSNNAYKHGLHSERNPLDLATDAALPHEQTQFLATLQALKDELAPVGQLETLLLERLAHLDLRLQRALRMETAHLDMNATLTMAELTAAGSTIATDTGAHRDNGLSMLAFLRDPNALTLIGRYESRLSRDFARTLAQFHQTQKLRKQTQTTSASPTRSLASDGQIAENFAEQTQPPSPEIPTRSHASDGVGINEAAQHPIPTQYSAEQSQSHRSIDNLTPPTRSASPTPQ